MLELFFSLILQSQLNIVSILIPIAEADPVFDSYLQSPIGSSQSTSLAVIPSPTSNIWLSLCFFSPFNSANS